MAQDGGPATLSMTVFCYDYVQAWSSEDSAFLPVIRVFGTTSSRERACAHVHGFFPYLYFRPWDMDDPTFAREDDVIGYVSTPDVGFKGAQVTTHLSSFLLYTLRRWLGQIEQNINTIMNAERLTRMAGHDQGKNQQQWSKKPRKYVRAIEVVRRKNMYGYYEVRNKPYNHLGTRPSSTSLHPPCRTTSCS